MGRKSPVMRATLNLYLVFQYNAEINDSQHIAGSILRGSPECDIDSAAVTVVHVCGTTKECGVDYLTAGDESFFPFK